MIIYYDKNSVEILTENEAEEKINDMLERNYTKGELLSYFTDEEIWDGLLEDFKLKILQEVRQQIIDEDFITREIKEI